MGDTQNNLNSLQSTINVSTSSIYSDYSNPIWFGSSVINNAVAAQLTPVSAITAPAATLVGLANSFRINLIWDATVSNAPTTFKAGIIQAAQLLCNSLSNNVVINIGITCAGTGGGAYAGPSSGSGVSYSTVRSDLMSHAATGDTTFNALPTSTSIQGQSTIVVWNAQLKLWGLATTGATDGNATFATDIQASLLPGVALHELTHAMGRVPYGSPYSASPDIFDLFRFTSAGNLLFTASIPSAASYFSLDGGKTVLANYGISSDPSDFLNSGVQGSNDPLNEFYNGSTTQTLSTVDLKQLDALGYTLKQAIPIPTSGNVATFLSNIKALSASSFVITDTASNIVTNIAALQSNVAKITSITQSDSGVALAISALQSSADNAVLAKISGTYNLTVTGTTIADTLYDTSNSHATMSGGSGADTFNIMGTDTINSLGSGGADVVKISAGASVTATLGATWTATSSTSNAANTPSATVNSNGFNISLAAATGASGWTLDATGTGTTSITGSTKSDIIHGNTAGGLTIDGHGGSDTIVLGTHTKADTVYLVANAIETITGFGGSTGTVADVLNVTATGNILAGKTLTNETALATNNKALAANSNGLVFSHADNGTALTATTAAALFSTTQAVGEFAIAKGSGIELLIETGATATSNYVWEIKDTAGVFTAIELTGVAVVSGHNLGFSNFH